MFLSGDKTKHMLLFIFHALYTCLTTECYQQEKEKKEERMDPMLVLFKDL